VSGEKNISSRIKELRFALKNADGKPLNQTEFAVSIGITQAAISLIENGGGVDAETLKNIK
jgi:hypothetical protein